MILLSQLNIYSQKFDSSDLYFEEAKKDIAEQNFTKAAKMSWRGLQISKNDLDLKVLLGKANLQLGKYDTARYVLKQVYDKRRKDIDVLQYLVTIEQTTKRYSDAICFVNELLEITPYSRGWHLRKIEIYKEMGNFEEAERALKRIYQIYPNDTEIESRYNYIMIGDGNDALKNKNYDDANVIYKTIIDNNPSNKDAYLGLIRNEILKGNPEVALQYTNRSLIELPSDRQLIEKKVGLLEQLGRHEEAIVFIQTDPNVSKDKFPELHSKTLPYLMQQSASFNEYNDTYEINKKLAEMNGNSESTAYVIKNALGKGYDVDAEYFLKKNIKRSPNNKKLLVQLKELYRPIKDKERFEKEVIELHEKFPNDTDITSDYNLVIYNRAKDLVINKQYGEALEIFNELVNFPDFTEESESQIFGIYLLQERYDEATDQIDKLIGLDPDNPDYLEKKSTLYQQMELFDDALEITRSLEQNYPLSQRYPTLYVSQIEAYATYLMREQRYRAVLPLVEDGLTRENNNKRLLDIAINASSAIPDYQKGINYGKSALTFYPNNKNFKLKLANLYSQNKQYDEAKGVLDSLRTVYVYDRNVKNALAEVLFYRARNQEEEGLVEEALVNYDSAVALNPADRGSLMRMVNLHIIQKPNDESLEFINNKLEKTPEDNFLLYKKGVVFELLQQYDSAYYYQKFREIDNPYEKQQWGLTLEVLRAAQLKNQLAATYLQASSDSVAFSTSIASLGYSHKYDEKNTFGANVNYAARRSGVGVQGGVNYSRIFSPTLYANAGVLFGNIFFPKFILYGDAYKGIGNGYEVQAGIRFSRLQNDINFITLNVGGTKTWEDILLTSKLSVLRDDQFTYFNLMAQTKINVNARKDYVTLIVSGGSAPFDTQLPEGETALLDFSNILIGAGYGYNISPKTAIIVNGTWINFKSPVTDSTSLFYLNQYNLSVTIVTKF
ncbi:tetratricopeptide repeat protein [Polaribacter vadi]|uniref:tetratricopeptide repeat protein n=1 Tax=Polaribacter vadi TaxID=1774273 RepID=UPI0014787942|nr:tetratricopeptide repeat protein [Polaribacter vadi]